ILGQQATLEHQDLLLRYPGYDQLAQLARKLRAELDQMPLLNETQAAAKTQADKFVQLAETSAAQEAILREIALRREPCSLVFPPLRTVKDVQKELPPGHAVLSFFCTSNQTHAFLMTNEKYGYWPLSSPMTLQRHIIALLRDLGNYEQNKELRLTELQDEKW